MGSEASHFFARMRGAANPLALRKNPSQEAHRLEEFEFVSAVEQSVF
jgi:hypothetical protein